jgi:AraC family transcriptional regulator
MSSTINYLQLPTYVPGRLVLDSSSLGGTDFRLRIFDYAASDVDIPPLDDYLVVVYRQGETAMNRRVTGPWKQDRVGRGVVSLLTRAENSHWHWGDRVEVTHFYISPASMIRTANEVFDQPAERMELRDVLRADDGVLERSAQYAAHEIAAGEAGGRLFVDALALQANIHILRNYASVTFRRPPAHGPFLRSHAQLIADFIRDNLDRNFSLAELAAVTGFAPDAFTRKFRAYFGMPPHSYVTQVRVEAAAAHLRRGALSIKEIALLTGFADQSHLTRIFRKEMGTTPADYRKGQRSTIALATGRPDA